MYVSSLGCSWRVWAALPQWVLRLFSKEGTRNHVKEMQDVHDVHQKAFPTICKNRSVPEFF